jgi:hypothetical protein
LTGARSPSRKQNGERSADRGETIHKVLGRRGQGSMVQRKARSLRHRCKFKVLLFHWRHLKPVPWKKLADFSLARWRCSHLQVSWYSPFL